MGIKLRAAVVALFGALLASCGGGGGGGDDPFNPSPPSVSIALGQSQTTPRSLVDIVVNVTVNGGPAPNGTEVVLQVSPASVGLVTAATFPGGGTGTVIAPNDRATSVVAGGKANFRFHSRAIGTAVLTASATVNAPAATPTDTKNLAVVAGPPSDPRLRLQAATLTLPPNVFGVDPFIGSPFMSEVVITWRRLNGELVTTVPIDPPRSLVTNVSINPVNPSGGFTTLDDPETMDDPGTPQIENNEFLNRLGQGPVDMVAGLGTAFVHAGNVPSQFVMTVTALDPDTDETLEASLTFNVARTTLPLPSVMEMTRGGRAVYVNSTNGNQSDQIFVNVLDGSGLFVPDPQSGTSRWNNVRFEIVGGAQGGERLRGVSAGGTQVAGAAIPTATAQGIAQVAYESGTRQGSVRIRAIVDRADNNIDNGVTDPLEAFTDIVVSDGQLFDLDITLPGGIEENAVSVQVSPDQIVNGPDGTYSFTVSAIATDRLGNPVLPGTEIRFGKIDSPLVRNEFVIADDDGDPQEGGTSFFDYDGAFTTLGGGVGAGDTLIVFAEDVSGHRDLEAARIVQSVNSPTSITVNRRFNYNDDTGTTVNGGPILPYIVGRSVDGNITASAFTNSIGVAAVRLNYPVSKLGKRAAIYAQANANLVNGTPELVTDAELVRYAGSGQGRLTATPSAIPGNRTVPVTVCYTDSLDNPITGTNISFAFTGLNGGTGSVEGQNTAGVIEEPTGADGCVTVDARTIGMVPPATGTNNPTLTFSVGPASTEVDIITGTVLLSVSPTTVTGDGGRQIRLRLTDAEGNPIQGAVITGTCTATTGGTLNITTAPPATNASGEATGIVTASGFSITDGSAGPTGSCVFRAGAATATVTWGSQDECSLFSPQVPAGCPSGNFTLTIIGTGTVTSTPTGLNCVGPTVGACLASWTPGTPVTLSASAVPTSWGGACASFGTSQVGTVVVSGTVATNCTVTFPP